MAGTREPVDIAYLGEDDDPKDEPNSRQSPNQLNLLHRPEHYAHPFFELIDFPSQIVEFHKQGLRRVSCGRRGQIFIQQVECARLIRPDQPARTAGGR